MYFSALVKSRDYGSATANTVDHIRPLSRHGHEAEYNLVPACGSCNYGKCDRLLTEWDPVRVAHAAAHSSLVEAELKRLTDDATQAMDAVTGKWSP